MARIFDLNPNPKPIGESFATLDAEITNWVDGKKQTFNDLEMGQRMADVAEKKVVRALTPPKTVFQRLFW